MKRSRLLHHLLVAATTLVGFGLGACDETQTTPPDATVADTSGEDVDTASGDSSEPDGSTPDVSEPDVVGADTSAADTSTPDTSMPDTSTPDADVSVPDGEVSSATSYTLNIGGWTMQPGAEGTRCVVVRLGNTQKIWVPRIHSRSRRARTTSLSTARQTRKSAKIRSAASPSRRPSAATRCRS